MNTDTAKLADALARTQTNFGASRRQCDDHGKLNWDTLDEAIAILRAAAAVDADGLMALADKMAERRSIYDQDLEVMGNNADANHANLARFNLESALRLALAAREGPPDTQGSAFGQITREHAHQLWQTVNSMTWRDGLPVHVHYAYALLRRFGKPVATDVQPLQTWPAVAVEGEFIVVRASIDALENGIRNSQYGQGYAAHYGKEITITDAHGFAKDVASWMCEEREDGSSLVTDLLDKAAEKAVEQGSEFVGE